MLHNHERLERKAEQQIRRVYSESLLGSEAKGIFGMPNAACTRWAQQVMRDPKMRGLLVELSAGNRLNFYDTGYFFDELFESGGRVRPEAAAEYVQKLKGQKRYQRDVY